MPANRELRFTKMHGGGNDFIVFDGVRQKLPSRLPAAWLANRRLGIGCDQILIIQKSKTATADFTYRIINADGGEVGQCGNGARCVHAFVLQHKLATKKTLRLQTQNTIITTENVGKEVRAYLAIPQFLPADIPMQRKQKQLWYAPTVSEGRRVLPGQFAALSLGNPHAVFMPDKKQLPDSFAAAQKSHELLMQNTATTAALTAAGEMLNKRRLFTQGVNVSFCWQHKNKFFVRVYERGVGETPSCGSAAVAVAIITRREFASSQAATQIVMQGGVLLCGWDGGENAAWLQGKINFVYDGIIRLPSAVK
ncbi:MAG: diaminopimelate epimerase [Gammaproteobacteria bacterium WSBS_2016_MAG_OTU1]